MTEFNGSHNNNLLRTEPGVEVRSVLLNPEGPASHRYVMAAADRTWWQDWKMDVPSMTRVEVSSDALDWKSLRDQPGIVAQQNKIMTIYRFNDYFHLGGYQIYPLVSLPLQSPDLGKDFWAPRTFSVWRSHDLERWLLENTKAFYKPLRSSSPYRPGWDREEVHVGEQWSRPTKRLSGGLWTVESPHWRGRSPVPGGGCVRGPGSDHQQ